MCHPPLPFGTPGTIGWHELYAGEWQSAFAFYAKMFGWTKAMAHDMGEKGGVYQLFASGADPVGGMMTKPPAIPRPYWGYYFNVPAVDAAADRVKAAGGKVINGPHEVPGPMYIIQCTDPQGAYFALVAPSVSPAHPDRRRAVISSISRSRSSVWSTESWIEPVLCNRRISARPAEIAASTTCEMLALVLDQRAFRFAEARSGPYPVGELLHQPRMFVCVVRLQ